MSGNIQDPYIGRFQDAMIQKYLCISSRDLNDKLKRIDSKNPLKKNVYEIMHKLSDMTSSSNWENTLIYAPNEEWKIRNFTTEQNIGLYGIQFDDQMVQIDEPKELIFAGPVNLPEFNLPVLFFFDYDLSEQQVNKIEQLMKSFESEHCNPYSRVTPDVDSLWTRWLRRGIPIPTHRPTFDIEHIDRIAKSERANIRLDSIAQIEALKAMPPLLINGQAGAGKTTVLAHRMAWSVIQHREHRGSDSRILYISYSEALTRQAGEDVRRIIETIHDKKPQIYLANMHFKTMHELLRGDAGGHAKNSQMGFGQFKTWYQQKRAKDHRSRSIPAERAWYAIRLLKGKTASSTRFRMGKEGKEHFLERMNSVAELRRWSESDQEYMFNIILDYQKKLADEKKWDDIDLARAALKRVDNGEKYDEIFCDEAQDFTQIELAYLKQKCSTNPLWPTKANACLNLAGDDMQTINPTGFNWKQYQEDWESQDAPLDMYKLSQNERSDKKIVDLANRFLRVQKELFGREVQQQQGSDFGERMPLFVVDDQGNKMEHQIADWVRKSIQYQDQNFGIIIEKEYEIDVISLLESDSLFQQILDSDLAKDEHIDLPDGTTHNINMAMKKLSDLKSEVEDPRKVNERTNILFTLLQKLRIYRVSDIKGLSAEKYCCIEWSK